MGRPPCCDQVGVKKGPWTPEEDIILVSYIQQHGPGNWRSVPTNTGLLRCSKSCRLRWTNYLRPGIKRGNFTPHEEGMIIHLQALLGNKWAAIASYLPQRTDNDIKNYWNTHLKKKLKKYQASDQNIHYHHLEQERAQEYKTRGSLQDKTSISSSSSLYASSTENISRLLEGWIRSTPNSKGNCSPAITKSSSNNDHAVETTAASLNCHHLKTTVKQGSCNRQQHRQQEEEASPSLSLLEKWLLDESTIGTNGLEEEEEVMEIPSIFS